MKIRADYFDLDMCQMAYQLAGKDVCWVSQQYTTPEGEFDEDKYYTDFDNWWDTLDDYEQEKIWNQMR